MCYLLWNKDVHFCRFSLKIGICVVEWLKSTSRDHKSTPKYTASVRVPQAFAHGWWFHWSLWYNCTYFPPFLMYGSRDLDDNLPINANNSQLLSKRCCSIRVCDENIVQLYISTYYTLIIICVKNNLKDAFKLCAPELPSSENTFVHVFLFISVQLINFIIFTWILDFIAHVKEILSPFILSLLLSSP